MTDTEKRAHDIAVATIYIQYDSTKHSTESFDIYDCYKAAYKSALAAIKMDCPDEG
ncbi:MAG: hypothetical protein LUI87_02105 [Lachnospiraceae bacterium]|nr:hypothetical protein [Lachnospiraceae bacterium]